MERESPINDDRWFNRENMSYFSNGRWIEVAMVNIVQSIWEGIIVNMFAFLDEPGE